MSIKARLKDSGAEITLETQTDVMLFLKAVTDMPRVGGHARIITLTNPLPRKRRWFWPEPPPHGPGRWVPLGVGRVWVGDDVRRIAEAAQAEPLPAEVEVEE